MIEIQDALAMAMVTVDEAQGRVYGWLPGIVTDIDKERKLVRARVGKQGDNESTDWLVPMFPGAVESTPDVDDPVGVFFMDGDVHRGAYFYYPQSTTKGRPKEAMALGTTFAGLHNGVQAAVAQILTDWYTSFQNSTYNTHQHTYIYGTTLVPVVPSNLSPPQNGGKVKASDGSVPGAKTTDEIALSGKATVR